MSMNATPSSERTHIGFFGCRNAGKSALVNAVTGQQLAIVSEQKGTTTDPVLKAMELLPLGPVVIIDTAGLDDVGELGAKRISKTRQILNKTDIAVLVVDATVGLTPHDNDILEQIAKKNIPTIVAINKIDLSEVADNLPFGDNVIRVSAETGEGIEQLKETLGRLGRQETQQIGLLEGLVEAGDLVVMVTPVDKAAPKGRLILPQQQTIRDALERGVPTLVVRDTELEFALKQLVEPPKLVITDSQVFKEVAARLPINQPLTSFSILMARYKGSLDYAVRGIAALQSLKSHARVLISEGCTHHRQCNDIGTVKLPHWIRQFTKSDDIQFSFTSGGEFPLDLSGYDLIVHCGGCMLNEREMKYRVACAQDQNIPMTNYGLVIAHVNGILKRSLQPFNQYHELIQSLG